MTGSNCCRLCLQKITESFQSLNKDLRITSMIKSIFPGMNINLVEESKICSQCFKYIQFSYTMRETVFKNEEKLNCSVTPIYTIEKNICRLCLNTDISEVNVFLYANANQTMPFLEARSVVEIAIMELGYDKLRKPVICSSCWKIVRLIYLFKKKCFATEKILKFYCTKNNLITLTTKEIESISNCYITHLQKFSKGEQHGLSTELIPQENTYISQQTTITSVDNIIKPIDVYLNNFTTQEEEEDDTFVETPTIVKKEPKEDPTDTLISDVKEEVEEHSIVLYRDMDEIMEVAREVKEEEARCLSIGTKVTGNNSLQGGTNNSQESSFTDIKSEVIVEETLIKNEDGVEVTSTEGRTEERRGQEENNQKACENLVYSRLEMVKNRCTTNSIEEIEVNGIQFEITKASLAKTPKRDETSSGKHNNNNNIIMDSRVELAENISSENILKNREYIPNKASTKVIENCSSEHNLKEMGGHSNLQLTVDGKGQKQLEKKVNNLEKQAEITYDNAKKRKSRVDLELDLLNTIFEGNQETSLQLETKKRRIKSENFNKTIKSRRHKNKNFNNTKERKKSLNRLRNIRESINCDEKTADPAIQKDRLENFSEYNNLASIGSQGKDIKNLAKKIYNPVEASTKSEASKELTGLESSSQNNQERRLELVVRIEVNKSILTNVRTGGEALQHNTEKGKKSLENLKTFTNSKSSSKENHGEISEPDAEKQKNLSEIGLKNVEQNSVDIETNKYSENREKLSKPLGKKIKIQKGDKAEWECHQCQFKTKYRHHLTRHSQIHDKNAKILTCLKCVYSTPIKRNFDRHMLTHSTVDVVQCSHCLYSTLYTCHLKEHMHIHDKTTEETSPKKACNLNAETTDLKKPLGLRCKECPFVTSKEVQLVAHLRTHKSTEKILKCSECYYITTRIHSLKKHMELHNEDSSKNPFKCDQCSFTGKRRTHLVSHMLKHQKEYNFSCSQCSYKAKRKSHLVTHMLRHQNSDKTVMFQCPYCQYKSIRREHLKSHCRNIHFDKKEVNCNEAKVTIQDDVDRFNQKKKTTTCMYCSYRGYRSTVDWHIHKVHLPSNSDQMLCNDCDFETDSRKLFLQHLKEYHNKHKKEKN